jgi:hypothetical protein
MGDLPDEFDIYRTTGFENCALSGKFLLADVVSILPANSVTTFISTKAKILGMNQPDDVFVEMNSGESSLIISGIDNGQGSTDNLNLEMIVSNESLFSSTSLGSISANGEAVVNFTPAVDETGISKVSLTLTDNDGNIRTVAFYISVMGPDAVIQEEENLFKLYPNPANGMVTIELSNNSFHHFEIFELRGGVCLAGSISGPRNEINISGLDKGIYLLKVSGDREKLVRKLIIK